MQRNRNSRPEVCCKKGVLRNFAKFTGKHLRQSLFLQNFANFCEISKNTFYYRTSQVAASERNKCVSRSINFSINIFKCSYNLRYLLGICQLSCPLMSSVSLLEKVLDLQNRFWLLQVFLCHPYYHALKIKLKWQKKKNA